MADLSKEISVFERSQKELEAQHMGEWVLIKEETIVSYFPSFEEAAAEAVKRFGSGPYLIRKIGAPPLTLSASVMYHL